MHQFLALLRGFELSILYLDARLGWNSVLLLTKQHHFLVDVCK